MPENSVDSYINAQPETVMSKDEFWQANYAGQLDGMVKNPEHYNDWNYKIAKFFGGRNVSKFEDEYEAYLNNINNKNEWLAQQSARAYDQKMADTQMQRLLKDYEAAGLNPYLLLNNNSLSGASVPTSAKADFKAKKREAESRKGRDTALVLLALARLAAALL